jgi:hypothetical protein
MQRSEDGLEILPGFSYSVVEVSRPKKSLLVVSSEEIVRIINNLCSYDSIIGFIVSGRSRDNLGSLLASGPNLGLAAEQGYFLMWSRGEEMQSNAHTTDFRLMQLAEPLLSHYTKAMDGSYVETKETTLVWHHQIVGTMGVALFVCKLPGQVVSDRLGPKQMELGHGIHGELGVAVGGGTGFGLDI